MLYTLPLYKTHKMGDDRNKNIEFYGELYILNNKNDVFYESLNCVYMSNLTTYEKALELTILEALKLLYQSIIPIMVNKTIEILSNPNHNGVFLVCANNEMCMQVYNLLVHQINPIHVLLLENNFPYLDGNDTSPIKVVIGPIRKAEGYTLSKLDVMITSVYMSNLATRHQIEGRINRISQKKPEIKIITLLAGFLNNIFERYENGRNFMECIVSSGIAI